MRHLIETILMIVAPFCLWYAVFILICAEWNISHWHWAARTIWVLISLITMAKIFKNFSK